MGWPSGGGSVNASVASIDNMQYFLDHFPSTARNANVTYYWFEGYDEPWKVIFNTATAAYEDKWVWSQGTVRLMIGLVGCKWVFEGWDYNAEQCLIDGYIHSIGGN